VRISTPSTIRFDTLEEAIEYLRSKGYAYDSLRERHQYRENGG